MHVWNSVLIVLLACLFVAANKAADGGGEGSVNGGENSERADTKGLKKGPGKHCCLYGPPRNRQGKNRGRHCRQYCNFNIGECCGWSFKPEGPERQYLLKVCEQPCTTTPAPGDAAGSHS